MSRVEAKSRVTYWPGLWVAVFERANLKREIVGVRGVCKRRVACWEGAGLLVLDTGVFAGVSEARWRSVGL